jgi:hypothetical protein
MPINKTESTKKVNLNLKGLTSDQKEKAKSIAGEIIVDEINSFLDKSLSPVKGGNFKKKKADGTKSELFEFGDMRGHITFNELDSDAISVGVFEDAPLVERLKSFNHNTGDTLPQRKFIAAPNQVFNPKIMKKVNSAIDKLRKTEVLESNDSFIDEILDGQS